MVFGESGGLRGFTVVSCRALALYALSAFVCAGTHAASLATSIATNIDDAVFQLRPYATGIGDGKRIDSERFPVVLGGRVDIETREKPKSRLLRWTWDLGVSAPFWEFFGEPYEEPLPRFFSDDPGPRDLVFKMSRSIWERIDALGARHTGTYNAVLSLRLAQPGDSSRDVPLMQQALQLRGELSGTQLSLETALQAGYVFFPPWCVFRVEVPSEDVESPTSDDSPDFVFGLRILKSMLSSTQFSVCVDVDRFLDLFGELMNIADRRLCDKIWQEAEALAVRILWERARDGCEAESLRRGLKRLEEQWLKNSVCASSRTGAARGSPGWWDSVRQMAVAGGIGWAHYP